MEIDVPVELLVKGLLAFQLPWANAKLNGGSQRRPGKKLHIVFSYIFLPKMSYLNSSWLKDKRKHKKQLNHSLVSEWKADFLLTLWLIVPS